MEKKITIGIRILAAGFFVQPFLVYFLAIRIYEGPNPGPLYAILGVVSLLCFGIGIAIWKCAPKWFVGIYKRFMGDAE